MTMTTQPLGEIVENWMIRPHPGKVILEGTFCTLEPLHSARHAADLFESFQKGSCAMWTYLPIGPFNDFDSYQALVDKISDGDDTHYAIISKETGHAVGQICLMRCDPTNGVVEVGFVIFSPDLSRTTMGTEAHYILMKYVFDDLKYRRYEWKCHSLNAPSRKAALRLGFQYEGTFRHAAVHKGRNRDTQWFSIIDEEWASNRLAFDKWLSRENFKDGKQKSSLTEVRHAILQKGK